MKKTLVAGIVLSAVAALAWQQSRPTQATAQFEYRTATIERGSINKSVSATGTLAAVDDVVVGSQLSGQITEVLVDFNDSVSQNQLLAKIDDRTFAAQVAQAQAQLQRTEADIALQAISIDQAKLDLAKAERDLSRGEGLKRSNNISEEELDQLATSLGQQQLLLQQAQAQLQALAATKASNLASLQQAQIQLDRTEIRAPISGFVIDRTIEAGQTVASSYNTPELFTLAKDLAQMEIEAYIDESDIGQIALKQRVNFTVDAFPDQPFRGQVSQIRRAPQSNSGVISYTVIINANNPANQLLPGMTANLDIQIDNLAGIQRVPNSALRLTARSTSSDAKGKARGPLAFAEQLGLSEQQQQDLRDGMPQPGNPMAKGGRAQMKQRMEQLTAEVLTPEQLHRYQQLQRGELKLGQLQLLKDGQPQIVEVQLGLADNDYTAILAPDLTGTEVITQIKQVKS
ncbi:efflux RND transporter periplasmic adaptor subunit [Ferrimonas senticii]|uniref:efflux RND transporter periplasmic adaptor subunit n=1 Tax=Ferrimonas senticii TaxID=394566 RepID=UPI00040B23F3|nr:efflux RND transporter periplasmic adaptor subunit [Ferrimonas senticii]